MKEVGSINPSFESDLQDGDIGFGSDEDQLAVEIKDVRIRLGETYALDGLNLSVPKGCIYGLLGPSGCGKTTLLSCLVNQLKIQEGQVKVFGIKPGSQQSGIPGPWVGYMPQDLCLYPELTIYQTLTYFGRLQRVNTRNSLKSRIDFLVQFLDLPDSCRLARSLSGGQQRRLSLAVALIHRPPLLLLDEPTVGIDPTLREVIWQYLLQLVDQDGLTVLITTHYFEEARKAHIIGLMRNGRVLIQSNPEELIAEHKVTSLEEVFLKYCIDSEKEETRKTTGEGSNTTTLTKISSRSTVTSNPVPKCQTDASTSKQPELDQNVKSKRKDFEMVLANPLPVHTEWKDHFRTVYAITVKSIQRLRMQYVFWLFVFLQPISVTLLLKEVIGHDPTGFTVAIINKENPHFRSKSVLDNLDKTVIIQKEFASEKDVRSAFKVDNIKGIITFGENFTVSGIKRLRLGRRAGNETIIESTIRVQMVDTNPTFALSIFGALLNSVRSLTADSLQDLGASPALASIPLQFQENVMGPRRPHFGEFLTSGLLCNIIYVLSLHTSGFTFTQECEKSLFGRSHAAGMKVQHLVISQIIMQYLVSIPQICSLLLFVQFSGIYPVSSLVMVTFVLFLQSTLGMAHGILISTIIRSTFGLNAVVIVIQTSVVSISGLVWPIEAMPRWCQTVCLCIGPDTAIIRSMRLILYHGQNLANSTVWQGCLTSIVFTIVSYTALVAVIKLRR